MPKHANPIEEVRHADVKHKGLGGYSSWRTRTSVTYQLEHVLCGKCPKWHGPYWYAYWRIGGKLRKLYIGRNFRNVRENEITKGDE